jgi:hypothetical protein
MEEKTKTDNSPRSSRWAELEERAKDDPQLARRIEVAKQVMERYSDTLQRLADS